MSAEAPLRVAPRPEVAFGAGSSDGLPEVVRATGAGATRRDGRGHGAALGLTG